MNNKKSNALMIALGVVVLIVCIVSSVMALKYGNELKSLTRDFTYAGSNLTASAEIAKQNIDLAKSNFTKFMSISMLTFLATILDFAAIYMKSIKNE